MNLALVRYDAAKRALAAAHSFDVVRSIRSRAEAIRVYARQAGDFELQNQAAEIRIRAERRAGQLLLEIEKNHGTRGEGRPRKDGTKSRRSSKTTAYPAKLEDIGITKDQSSKWQRLALLVNESTFERALAQAREKNGELTNAALLREIREVVTPSEVLTEPDINVIASELIRDIESASRREKLERVTQSRNRLNPTIRKKLMLALKNSLRHTADFEAQLSKDFKDFPTNEKCHQRIVRELMAEQPDPLLSEKKALAADFKNASLREISLADARNLIVAQEWLGNLPGGTEHAFGLCYGNYLAGCVCFGSTAGTKVKASVCGAAHANKVTTLTRGCTLAWADPIRRSTDGRTHTGSAASFLISAACREMTKKGYNVFVAYADPKANELGSVYQSVGWNFCGYTNPTEKFKRPDGKVYDARNVHLLTRDRRFGMLRYKRSRAQQKELLISEGCEFFKDDTRKLRYVGFYGDRRTKRILRAALRWETLPYPKRGRSPEDRVQVVNLDPAPKSFAATVS
jgi:hypothetical protein